MNIRRITSLTAFLSFFIVLLTSVILYIVPQGRVAYWADWRLWSLSKEQWGAIHINVGVLFLFALSLHIYYNWKPIVLYLKNKARRLRIFTKDFNVAALFVLCFIIGSYSDIPPFSTIITISDEIKEAAARKYGEPPYGHAELSSLKTFAQKMGIDLKSGMMLLRKKGYKVDDEAQILQEIASNNGVSPQQIYLAMIPAAEQASNKSSELSVKKQTLPNQPPPGTGNLTLADLCSQYNLNIKIVIRSLKDVNIEAKEHMTIKKIGEANTLSPVDIYDRIKTIADNQGLK